jgi:hypothetical protein
MQAIQFNSHGRGTNSPVEHYTGGHGMSFCLEDQKPQPPEPPSPPLGLFFLGTSGRDPGEQFCTDGYCQGVQASGGEAREGAVSAAVAISARRGRIHEIENRHSAGR